jgi:peptidoglycan/LPS O-acetylase OafA/YrhL
MEKDRTISTKYVGVLDGIRAISVIIVLIFHFWQQTWIFPVIKTPFLSFLKISQIDFTPFARVGYLFVDMMVLISGFLLFLPVARNVFSGESMDKWGVYFKKRAARILPSYLFCILVLFVYALAKGAYGTPVVVKDAVRDLVLHIFFLHTFTVQTYLSTPLNVVLWTLAVEVWFYILFPIFAAFIRRQKCEKTPARSLIRAAVVVLVFMTISHIYIYKFMLAPESGFTGAVENALALVHSNIRAGYAATVINQLPAFFETYAVGLIGAFLYVFLAKKLKRGWVLGIVCTALSVLFIVLITKQVKECARLELSLQQQWQVKNRLNLSLSFMGFILSTAFSLGFWRFIFSNKLMVFLAAISYNLYIWHQWLAVAIKNDLRLPHWEGDTPPNQWGTPEGVAWSHKYALIITLAAFAAAALVTYLLERPASDLMLGKPSIYNGKLCRKKKAESK